MTSGLQCGSPAARQKYSCRWAAAPAGRARRGAPRRGFRCACIPAACIPRSRPTRWHDSLASKSRGTRGSFLDLVVRLHPLPSTITRCPSPTIFAGTTPPSQLVPFRRAALTSSRRVASVSAWSSAAVPRRPNQVRGQHNQPCRTRPHNVERSRFLALFSTSRPPSVFTQGGSDQRIRAPCCRRGPGCGRSRHRGQLGAREQRSA